MENLENYLKTYEALASFVNDFCILKEKNGLSQKEIANMAGTTQSAISRIETLKTNPSYKVLEKLSEAVGGKLVVTPMGEMTITVPFGLQQEIKEIADKEDITIHNLLLKMIKNEIKFYRTKIENEKFESSSVNYYKNYKILNNNIKIESEADSVYNSDYNESLSA